jgi:hypothetical protein
MRQAEDPSSAAAPVGFWPLTMDAQASRRESSPRSGSKCTEKEGFALPGGELDPEVGSQSRVARLAWDTLAARTPNERHSRFSGSWKDANERATRWPTPELTNTRSLKLT